MESHIESCLVSVRNWAREKIEAGREPPWAWYQYMKLVDAVDSIRRGRANVTRIGADSPQPARPAPQHPEKTGRTADKDSERFPDEDQDPPLPM
jgi:hypothetical protein